MTPGRRIALAGGIAYLATFAFSIPVLGLYEPVLDHPEYVSGNGADNQVLFGGFVEFLLALSCVASAVALYPVTRRLSRSLGLGFVLSRTLEAGLILVGMVSMLSIVTLRQEGGDEGTARALLALHDWTFTFGQGLMPVVNALCLGPLLYRSGLVPRWIPLLGLVGAPILFASKIVVLFDGIEDVGAVALVCALPIAVWEFSLGIRLVAKGFTHEPEGCDHLGQYRGPQGDITRPMLPADLSSFVPR